MTWDSPAPRLEPEDGAGLLSTPEQAQRQLNRLIAEAAAMGTRPNVTDEDVLACLKALGVSGDQAAAVLDRAMVDYHARDEEREMQLRQKEKRGVDSPFSTRSIRKPPSPFDR